MRRRRGMTFVTVMIVVALTALFLRFAIEQLIGWNIAQDESNARETLKLISTALENYAKDHMGGYPGNLTALYGSQPPYIEKSYAKMGTVKGYAFDCSVLDPGGYSCSASPSRCRLTGKTVFRVTTGGSMTADLCSPRE
jgi:type II secretory pathway pseudopilin PulG